MTSLFDGKLLFELKTVHGSPLELALDKVVNERGRDVDWRAFVDAARGSGWWDFQTYEVVCHAMEDAGLPRGMQADVLGLMRAYMVDRPHPEVTR